ncbi:MAG: succinylglutamate desuccinylase/aspartoacylase family protein [Gammaproteobacteria bacterium]|nr:succinylglutamate desuccinylase/aspartoacylase family protein [Gammaproteobacteria bacterium]
MLNRLLFAVSFVLLISSCATSIVAFDSGTACEAESFSVIDNFAGARRGRCSVLSSNSVQITILPEDGGYINDSPWYSFRLVPKTSGTATITMRYRGGHHRYPPKFSRDGLQWSTIRNESIAVSDDAETAVLTLTLTDETLWISGQELITPPIYDIWNRKMARHDDVQLDVLGQSKLGQPIQMLSSQPSAKDVLLLVGRQHPPEVSGAFAFIAFAEELFSATELACDFRARFQVIAIPLMNPDGVIGGNWRHNLGGTDLNRDWGPFSQPETALIRDLLDDLDASGKRLRIFLDFHSTKRNLFYTQDDANVTNPPLFTRTWLDNSAARVVDYPFSNEERSADTPGVAKNYMYRRYGIPASTYEVGDETDRAATQAAARVFAQELMELMLEQVH